MKHIIHKTKKIFSSKQLCQQFEKPGPSTSTQKTKVISHLKPVLRHRSGIVIDIDQSEKNKVGPAAPQNKFVKNTRNAAHDGKNGTR